MTPEDIAAELADHEARLTVCEHREKKLEEQNETLNSMAVSLKEIAVKQNGMESTVSDIKADVTALKDKPGKRLEMIVGYISSAIIGAVIAYLWAVLIK